MCGRLREGFDLTIAGASTDSNPPLRWGYHCKVTFPLTVGGSMRGDGLALAASVVRGGFLYALKNILPFRGVSKWCFLVNEMSMVFLAWDFYGI